MFCIINYKELIINKKEEIERGLIVVMLKCNRREKEKSVKMLGIIKIKKWIYVKKILLIVQKKIILKIFQCFFD